jgi:hypothetical protein
MLENNISKDMFMSNKRICDRGVDMYYYDIVASICDEFRRTDSHLVCGGFKTEEEAINYINVNDVCEGNYYKYCHDNETAYIEIEKRSETDGSLVEIILVD